MKQKILVVRGENPMGNDNLQQHLSEDWIIKTISGSCCYVKLSGLVIITHILLEKICPDNNK